MLLNYPLFALSLFYSHLTPTLNSVQYDSYEYINFFSELEAFALLVACMCHDLDHRGTNNTFQVQILIDNIPTCYLLSELSFEKLLLLIFFKQYAKCQKKMSKPKLKRMNNF